MLLPLIRVQKLQSSFRSIYRNATSALLSTKPRKQPAESACRVESIEQTFLPGEDCTECGGDWLDCGVDEPVPDPAEAVDAEVEEAEGRAAAPHVEHSHHAEEKNQDFKSDLRGI